MTDAAVTRRTELIFLAIVLCASLALCLVNLGNHYLWQDEAQTALISKTVLTHGTPQGYNGLNYLSQEIGAEYSNPENGDYTWRWHTWLTFYVLAAFFKLFGEGTLVARLPFAIFGIATVFMTYAFCRAYWKDRKVALFTAALLLLSVPFLILCRQCRWYSLSTFFSMWCLHAYVGLLQGKKRSSPSFVIASFLLFHTHYVYCATMLGAVGLHALLFHFNRFKRVFILGTVVVLINLPWILWLAGMRYGDRYGGDLITEDKFFHFTRWYFRLICTHIFTPASILILLLAGIASKIKTGAFWDIKNEEWKKTCLLLFFTLTNIVALSIASPWPYFRYISPIVPVLIVVLGLLAASASRLHWGAAVAIGAAWVLLNPMADFLYELTHDYNGPNEGIVKYLNEHAEPDDIVLATYGDMPLKFYTGLRVIGGLTGEDLSEAEGADWVIFRHHKPSPLMHSVFDFVDKDLPKEKYELITLDYPDIPFENREEPEKHLFRTSSSKLLVPILRKK